LCLPITHAHSVFNKNSTKNKCAAAGYVLMPFGAAWTVVGIPLYVKGKYIAELNFNYTGNGAGIAMNFQTFARVVRLAFFFLPLS
jgi:hypothetical protein